MIVSRGYLDILPKKISSKSANRKWGKWAKTRKSGCFLAFFENIFVPEGRILMRTKKLNSPGNFTLENICPTFCRAFRADTLGLTNANNKAHYWFELWNEFFWSLFSLHGQALKMMFGDLRMDPIWLKKGRRFWISGPRNQKRSFSTSSTFHVPSPVTSEVVSFLSSWAPNFKAL